MRTRWIIVVERYSPQDDTVKLKRSRINGIIDFSIVAIVLAKAYFIALMRLMNKHKNIAKLQTICVRANFVRESLTC